MTAREHAACPVPCYACACRVKQRAHLMTVGGPLTDFCPHVAGGVAIAAEVRAGAVSHWRYEAPAERPVEADADRDGAVSRADFRKLGRHAA